MEENNDNTFLGSLNDMQRAAVEYCDGPQLVIAGAGSGKTRVLTYKVAYLMTRGMKPWNILALTFTNKAASEMKERINTLVGGNMARSIYMGTFHSIFSRILRAEAARIGYTSSFTIYDDNDSKNLMKAIVKELQLNDKVYKPSAVASRIGMAKNRLVTAADYAADRQLLTRDMETHMPDTAKLYSIYSDRCRRANAMDFDDLLLNTYILFRDYPEVCDKYARQFQYILVDEYQDTNVAQQKIVEQLARHHRRVCAVGDDAQSIYAFRGANIDNMLAFESTFQGSRIFKLEQNYRSTQRIVEAANSLISHNQRQIRKDVFSRNSHGEKIKLKMAYSDREEAAIVCKDIKRMARQGAAYSDFAILYRTNAQSRTFEEALRKEMVPYRIYGGLSFYQRKEIKDVIAYFRLVCNPHDEEALKRIINYPARGIGATTLTKITDTANAAGVSLWQVLEAPGKYGLAAGKATITKLEAFRQLISQFIERAGSEDAYTVGHELIKEAGIAADLYADREPESVARQENLEEFLNAMQDFVEGRREDAEMSGNVMLSDFLQEVSLLTDIENSDDDEGSKVSLMTIHSAKGLEFPHVFIVGLEENIFPSPRSCETQRQLEEERRLLYVAITRAEQTCELTCAKNRYRFGRMEFDTPSRFIKDIDSSLLEVTNMQDGSAAFMQSAPNFSSAPQRFGAPREEYGGGSSQYWRGGTRPSPSAPVRRNAPGGYKPLDAATPTARPVRTDISPTGQGNPAVAEGTVVEHSRFGIGTVMKVEGVGENCKATVAFKNAGTKQLLMKFARLKIIK